LSTQTLIVPPELNGQRLDVALAALLPDTTRSAAARLIVEGRVDLAYGKARASRSVAVGETLTAHVAEETPVALAPSSERLSIVYEDRDVAVVDKPAGLTVHPGAGHVGDTLVNRLLGYDPAIAGAGDVARPGIVHRLDKDTSGLIVVARTPAAHAYLTRQWRERTVVKRYWALVEGRPAAPTRSAYTWRRLDTPWRATASTGRGVRCLASRASSCTPTCWVCGSPPTTPTTSSPRRCRRSYWPCWIAYIEADL